MTQTRQEAQGVHHALLPMVHAHANTQSLSSANTLRGHQAYSQQRRCLCAVVSAAETEGLRPGDLN